MAISLVGSVGAVFTGTVSPLTPAWGTGESRSAGNLLIAIAGAASSTANPITVPSGWSSVGAADVETGGSHIWIFYKIAAGGDAAPSIAIAGITTSYAQLSEWTGNDTSSPLDQSGGATYTSGLSYAVTASGSTGAAGGLAIASWKLQKSGGSASTTWSFSVGTQLGVDGASSVSHYAAAYQLGPTAGSAATNTATQTITPNAVACQIAVFKAAVAAVTAPQVAYAYSSN